MFAGKHDEAVPALAAAMKHAVEFDKTDAAGMEQYTCPVLFGYTEDHREDRKEDWSMTDDVKCYAAQSIFDPIRGYDDFMAIFG